MPVELKDIRNFMRDVGPHAAPASEPLWQAGSGQPLDVAVHSIAPGKEYAQALAADEFELMICWRGRGKAVIGTVAFSVLDFEAGDTLVIPPGLSRKYRALKEVQPENKPDKQPAEKLILITVRTKLPAGALTPDTAPITDVGLLRRKIANYCYYNRIAEERCVRSRIWGRDGMDVDGRSDTSKPYLHFTAYCFVPQQKNPEHYHPQSIELVICLQGEADVTTRVPAIPGSGEWDPRDDGWDAQVSWVMREGNALLVPVAALHQYVTRGNEDLILLAMQSPQPIMHILGPEVSTLP